MDHSPGFLKLVSEVRPRVRELTVAEARQHLQNNPQAVLLDVREDHEWQKGHPIGAVHLGKGILERDLEARYPDLKREIIMYCGGGFRSVLTADIAQRMGYSEVYSLAGGYKAMLSSQWPMASVGGF
ncbi:MAG: rhodanese-like domain-containing protein [Verrucomicrobiota bacterium]